jgi:hypothetical protein
MLVLVLALAACKGDKKEASKKETEKAQEPAGTAQTGVKMTVDGNAVGLVSAFAWKAPDGIVTVLGFNRPSSCKEATAGMREVKPGEESFTAAIVQTLQPDGSFQAQLASTSYSGNTRAGNDVGTATVQGDVTPGQTTKIDLAFELDNHPWRDDEKQKHLKVEGTVEALGCEAPDRAKQLATPTAEPQAASITVAGKKLPIAGAALEQKADGRTLVLATGPATCGGFASGDGDLVAILRWRDKDEVWQADLMGRWLGATTHATQIFDAAKPTAEPNKAPADAKTLDVVLGGGYTIDGYAVQLEGKVSAIVCPAS